MSSRRWSSEEAANGCRYNVVERVTVSSMEKPNTRNPSITNPEVQERSHTHAHKNMQ